MADSLALSGLASGVDTSSIVSQLMALDRQTTTRKALGADASWAQKQTAESSDAKVAVALVGGAGIGGHTVQVDRLAASMQRGFSFDSSTGGTIHLESASSPGVFADVTVAAGATLQSVADAINAKTAGPVVAAFVKDSGGSDRLVLSSRKTGSLSDFTVTGGGVLTSDPPYASPSTAQTVAELFGELRDAWAQIAAA